MTATTDVPRAYITGAHGFIGTRLCVRLDRLHRVWDIHRIDRISGRDFAAAELELALARPEDVVWLLGANADAWASVGNPVNDIHENVVPILRQAEMAKDAGAIVFASSFGGMYQQHFVPRAETDLPRPQAPYFIGKLLCEYYLEHLANPEQRVVSLRLANVYGPNGRGIVGDWIKRIRAGETAMPVYGSPTATRDYVYIEDVVTAFQEAGRHGSGVYHIGSGELTTVEHLLELMSQVTGVCLSFSDENARPHYVIEGARVDAGKAIADGIYDPFYTLEHGLSSCWSASAQ